MDKKIVVGLVIIVLVLAIGTVFLGGTRIPLSSPQIQDLKISKVQVAESLKEYTDPSGFSFSYPDNLSLTKNETDDNTYADLELFSKDISGSLKLRISDSKYKSLEEWINLNKGTIRDLNLGNLKAKEITTKDRLFLGSLDQGIFFTIEMPLIENDFWSKVYQKILTNFSFQAASQDGPSQPSDINFEGEEVVD